MPSNNKDYQKKYIKQHYQINKQYYKDKAKKRKEELLPKRKAIIKRYLLMKGCIDCGYRESHFALDFDHVRGEKKGLVSRMINSMTSWKAIKEEVAKCEVRCANCHRIVTALRAGWYLKFVALSS